MSDGRTYRQRGCHYVGDRIWPTEEKAKLLNRLIRLRGQIEAIEGAVKAADECADVLHQATACRGALDGFIAEVIEDHIREHMIDPQAGREAPQVLAAEELIEIVHQYLKR
jgi:DNA-binding FrmR family transcriptional regulator